MPNFISRVYAIIRKRPNGARSGEANGHQKSSPATRGHTGHDHHDFASIPGSLTTGFAPTHVDHPMSERLSVSTTLEPRESLLDDVGHENVTQRLSCFSQSNGVTVNGGEFYAVGGNMTIQRTELNNNNQVVARAFDNYAERTDRRMERLEEMIGVLVQAQYCSQMPPTTAVGFIYVMDATGRKHPLTMNMAGTLEQFHDALQVLFKVGTPEDKVLRRYMDIGAYVLSIDDGAEGIQLLSPDIWSSVVQHGTTVVMSIVMRQEFAEREYKCQFCYNWNALRGQSSIDCCSCNRRFKVTSAREKITKLQASIVPYQERNLIRNIHLEQYNFQPKTSGSMIFDGSCCFTCGIPTEGDDLYCSPKCLKYDSFPPWTGNTHAAISAWATELPSGASAEDISSPWDD